MNEVDIDCGWVWAADQLDQLIGHRTYHLHNRIGCREWEVRPLPGSYGHSGARIRVPDPEVLTYLLLKIQA